MEPDPIEIPEHLRYRDGRYAFERFGAASADAPLRERQRFARALRAIHRPWFAVRMPDGVAELTTVGRKSGEPRSTFVRAYRDGDRAYLVAITGEQTLWLKNIRADPHVTLRFRGSTLQGIARAPRDDERAAIVEQFSRTHPFDYAENLFHRSGLPNRRKVIELHRAWLEGGTVLVVDAE
ncbi:MAG: nitroreductase family deazaflavin-dependent oxidoreductase [Gordonia sp. (in: high G+C Gram-positive bacteria)]|uniref:nitroreductase family deazaflavin-dependent oxidoreductase n=1 Tax=Gordonia sp. (in: high G+C Gram-positive bacteria) TaxID=84139 RepID=UPI0039E389E2